MNKKHAIAATLVAGASLVASGAAQAQAATQWLFKAGYNNIMPKVKSGDLSPPAPPGAEIDIGSAASLILTAAYMFTDNASVELLAGLPYKHDIFAAGSQAGVGKIGSVHQISPTVMAQWRFLPPESMFRPYVGLGLTYAVFYDTEGSAALTAITNPGGQPGTTIGGDHAFGATGEIGLTFKINEQWFVDAALMKTYISTHTALSTGQTIDVDQNPVAANISIGYRY
jgi:outer membrane protein